MLKTTWLVPLLFALYFANCRDDASAKMSAAEKATCGFSVAMVILLVARQIARLANDDWYRTIREGHMDKLKKEVRREVEREWAEAEIERKAKP